jgi:hypothetical protein
MENKKTSETLLLSDEEQPALLSVHVHKVVSERYLGMGVTITVTMGRGGVDGGGGVINLTDTQAMVLRKFLESYV